MVAVQIMGFKKRFGQTQAVDGVDLNIRQGEIFSLLGPNGAGKSTTISMLCGLLGVDEGDALIDGHSIRTDSVAAQKVLGVVPQDIALYQDLTAKQNLIFWGRMLGLKGDELKQRVNDVLEMIELTERQNDVCGKYSGGMKRRLNIGVALLHKPRVLVLDEPTVGIDPQSRRKILDSVKALREEGTTILYTTHYMEEAQELSDRIAIMDEGKIIACGTQSELVKLVGEQDHIRLCVDHMDERFETEMKQFTNGAVITTDHQQMVEIIAANGSALLPDIIAGTNQLGVRILSIDIREANLEMVFLHLTGKALRDE
jgi:ABC-2 type transport system ATP-binding protein